MTDQTTPLTNQQIDDIQARHDAATSGPWRGSPATDAFVGEIWSTGDLARCLARVSSDADAALIAHAPQDVAALIAEVRRLQTELAREERLHGDTIDDRDRATDMADKLAYAVASETVIGEHTADNSPWANALELITSAEEVDRLRARVLTESEYNAAWHAVEGAAGEEGADPGTVLHAVLDRLGIEWQDAARPAGVPDTAAEYRHTCHDQTSAPGRDYDCQWCSTLPESLPTAALPKPGHVGGNAEG